jgi:hypothetical protein
LVGYLNGSFDQPSIHLPIDESLAEGHERPFAKRCLICVQAIEYQLPPAIHECRFNDLII